MTISAIIPCYRCAGTVRRAVLSVAAQVRRPVELVLVDDASDDDTGPVLRALQSEFGAWLRIIALTANRGAAAARNAGWDAAQGAYVAFLDADDAWLPDKIDRQHRFMQAHPEFAITGHLARYGERTPDAQDAEFREITRLMVLLKNPMVTPSFMLRRDTPLRFEAHARHMEDHRFLQEAVFRGLRVARLRDVLAVVHKPAYGAAGLSSQLWAMERGELGNYSSLRKSRRIGAVAYGLLVAYSLSKYCRRLVLVGLRRLARLSA